MSDGELIGITALPLGSVSVRAEKADVPNEHVFHSAPSSLGRAYKVCRKGDTLVLLDGFVLPQLDRVLFKRRGVNIRTA